VPAPNRLLVADFTYVKLVTGAFCCVAFVIDAYAGAIVGREGSTSKETRFVESAIRQAAALRSRQGHPIDGAIHHSDAGWQYTSVRFGETLSLSGLRPSIGSVGDAFELITTDYVGWYNQQRLMHRLGRVPPAEAEARYCAERVTDQPATDRLRTSRSMRSSATSERRRFSSSSSSLDSSPRPPRSSRARVTQLPACPR
jgi:putative transposase